MPEFATLDLGLIGYQKALDIQHNLVSDIHSGKARSTLLLCEHPAVITKGRRAGNRNILASEARLKELKIDVCDVNRGGDVTMHLPGQLVIYPVFDLCLFGKDIHRFLRRLEEAVIITLASVRVDSARKHKLTGVWCGEKKIASIGIAIQKWVTSHGISINIDCSLDLFSLIRPCGQDIIMTSAAEINNRPINKTKFKTDLILNFKKVFSE